jgi:hypothetical protein
MDVELTVTVENGRARATCDDGRASDSSPLAFDALRLKTIGVFVSRLDTADMRRKELETLGEHLYAGLFTGAVRDFVEDVLNPKERDRVLLRLTLPQPDKEEMTLDDQFAVLPWEYLFCPGIGGGNPFFVTQQAKLVLSRYMPLELYGKEAGKAEPVLRIGLVVASPRDEEYSPIVAGSVVEAVEGLDRRDDVSVHVLEDPTPNGIEQWLRDFQPHVMHFIGHGGYDRGERSAKLVLLDEHGESRDVADSEFGQYLQAHTPTIVVLHLPEGASRDVDPNMARLAPALIRAGVPAVVAMQHPFPKRAATSFSAAFYEALADEEAIDVAVLKGRIAYLRGVPGAADDRSFGTPVLFARAYSKVVEHPVDTSAAEEAKAELQLQAGTAGPKREPAVRQRADQELESVAQLDDALSPGRNGGDGRSPEFEGLLRAVIHAGKEELERTGLRGADRAPVYTWFDTLDKEFPAGAAARDVANFIRYEWVEDEPDEQRRSVAVAMQRTAAQEEEPE